jgi:hypothetical protein
MEQETKIAPQEVDELAQAIAELVKGLDKHIQGTKSSQAATITSGRALRQK